MVDGAAHYRLYSSDAESGDYTEIAAAAGTGRTYAHTGLDPNTAYFYKIKACIDDSGDNTCSEFSDAATATTQLPAKPEMPTAAAVSATGIMISWSMVDGAAHYRLYSSGAANGDYTEIAAAAGTGLTYTHTGLDPNTAYFYRIRACIDSSGDGTCSEFSDAATATTQLPAKPEVPTAAAVSATGIMISWSMVDGAAHYRLYSSDAESGDYTEIAAAAGTGLTYTHTGLDPNTAYFYRIRACVDSSGDGTCSEFSDVATATTQLPAKPEAPTATVREASRIDLSWNEVDGATHYRLYSSTMSASGYNQIAEGAEIEYEHTALAGETTYYYRVRACVDSSGEDSCSIPSDEANATTPAAVVPAATPNAPIATAVSASQIDLSWDVVTDAGYYRIYASTARDSGYSQISEGVMTTFQHTGLAGETTWYYRLTACGDNSDERTCSARSEPGSATTPAAVVPASTPDAPTATAVSASQIDLSWDAVADAGYYRLYGSATMNGGYSQIGEGVATTFQHVGLEGGTTWYYRLTACGDNSDERTCSARSAPASATTPAAAVPTMIPENLTAEAVSATRIDLSWDAAADAGYYRLYSSDAENGDYAEITDAAGAGTDYEHTELTSNTAYYYKVRACGDSSGESTCSALSGAVSATTQLPAKPEVPTAAAVSATGIMISWGMVDGAAHYRLYSSDAESGDYTEIAAAAGTGLTYTHTGLDSNAAYFYRIRACIDSSGDGTCSEFSDAGTATTQLPTKPEAPTATAESAIGIMISWNMVEGAAHYRLYSSDAESGDYTEIAAAAGTGLTYTHTGLDSNTAYFYKVRACVDSSGDGACSEFSDAASATTQLPAKPEAPTATVMGAARIDLSWGDVDGAMHYRLYGSATSGNGFMQVSEGSSTLQSHSNLIGQATWYYRVRACADSSNEDSCSVASDETSATTEKPATPVLEAPTVVSASQIDLSWQMIPGASYYRLYKSPRDIAGTYTEIAAAAGTAITYSDTGLTGNTNYYYRVRACADDSGIGTCSDESTAVGATTISPVAPDDLTATSAGADQIDLSWTDIAGAMNYRIFRSVMASSGFTQIDIIGSGATPYEDTGLTGETTYYYRVRACSYAGSVSTCSAPSDVESATTGIPGIPDAPTATGRSATRIDLSWDMVPGAGFYRIYSSDAEDGTYVEIPGSGSPRTAYSHDGLTAGTTYYYKISACASSAMDSCSAQSPAGNGTTIPAASTGLRATVTSTTISLTWNVVVGADYYRLSSSDALNGTYAEISTGDMRSYTHTGLMPNTAYYYRVSACLDDQPETCSVQADTFMATTAPAAPVVDAAVMGGGVELTWADVAGALRYEVWRGDHAGGESRVAITGGAGGQPSHPTASPYSDATAAPSTTWYYWLRGCSAMACSDFSEASLPVVYADGVRLNDTGILFAGNAADSNSDDCTSDVTEPQDCAQGRDAQNAADELSKVGQGVGGFDFTKLASTGTELGAQDVAWDPTGSEGANSQWACVRDNHTGLVWEVKSTTGVHNKDATYQWGGLTAEGRGSGEGGTYLADDDTNGWDPLVKGSNSEALCGLTNWRVPTLRELASVTRVGSTPAIDTAFFPNTPSTAFWSATSHASNTANAMSIAFGTNAGVTAPRARTSATAVRLVSGAYESASDDAVTAVSGQTHHAWASDHTPDGRYTVDSTNGTVIDKETGLMWQRCVAGATGDDCTGGSLVGLSWQAALALADSSTFASFDGWRLPNLAELRSIVAYDRHTPAINATVFPTSNLAQFFWSSSPDVGNAGESLGINFVQGADDSAVRTATRRVRLVRDSTNAPPAPIAEVVSAMQINLSWSEVTGYPHYRLFRGTSRDRTLAMEISDGAARQFMDTGLTASTPYYYSLEACTDSGEGTCTVRSAVRSATTTQAIPMPPDTPIVRVLSPTEIDLSWEMSTGAGYYRLYRDTSPSGGGDAEIYAGSGLGHSDSALTKKTTYYYRVAACINALPATCSAKSDAGIGFTRLPATPVAPRAIVRGTSQIDLTWETASGAIWYLLYRVDDGVSDYTPSDIIYRGNGLTYMDTGLQVSTYYNYKLQSCADIAEADCSDLLSPVLRVKTDRPAPPDATVQGSGQIDLTWSAVSGATHYRLSRNTMTGGSYNMIDDDDYDSTALSYSDTGVMASTTYYYVVAACEDATLADAVCSENSAPRRATTENPAKPLSLTATAGSPTQIDLSWEMVDDARWYRLETSDDGTTYTLLAQGNELATLAYAHTGLTANTVHYYRLAACSNNQPTTCSPWSDRASARTALPSPAGLMAEVTAVSTVTVSWGEVGGATLYRLYRSDDGGGSYTEIAMQSARTYDDSGLPANTSYSYQVAACMTNEESTCSARSDAVSVTTAPVAPTNPVATVMDGDISLSWDESDGAGRYQIWRGPQAGGGDRILLTGGGVRPAHPTASPYSDATAAPTTTWYYWIQACGPDACSDFSEATSPVVYTDGVRLNDTGILFAGNAATGNRDDCSGDDISVPQDCDQGRDAQDTAGDLSKVGQGVGGFDFTKLASGGTELAAQNVAWDISGSEGANSQWACVRDNHTGLVWEVKTDDAGIHDKDTTYQWGGIGSEGRGSSDGSRGTYLADDDVNGWDRLVKGSNSEALCGLTNWRVPTLRELASVTRVGSTLAIDTAFFPNTPSAAFWSATSHASNTANAMSIAFGTNAGVTAPGARTTAAAVRLVSGAYESASDDTVTAVSGQTHRAWASNHTPDGRYTVVRDSDTGILTGTVIDTETGLMWQRCVAGATGDDCTGGSLESLSWQAALALADSSGFAGFSDWRLPNLAELRSIMAYDRHTPAINATVFPTSSAAMSFWSSSPSTNAANALAISFATGADESTPRSTDTLRVRLVRDNSDRPAAPNAVATGATEITATWSVVTDRPHYRLFRNTSPWQYRRNGGLHDGC